MQSYPTQTIPSQSRRSSLYAAPVSQYAPQVYPGGRRSDIKDPNEIVSKKVHGPEITGKSSVLQQRLLKHIQSFQPEIVFLFFCDWRGCLFVTESVLLYDCLLTHARSAEGKRTKLFDREEERDVEGYIVTTSVSELIL